MASNGNGDLNRREGYTFHPLNRTVYDTLSHHSGTPAPRQNHPEMDNGNSTSVPLTEFDVEHATTKGTKYGSIAGDDSSSIASSIKKEDLNSPTPPINWLPNQRRNLHDRLRYCAYYLPFLSWMPHYQLEYLRGDAIAALTVGSLYIPMCFSFAILGRVDPISGLYAFVFHPLIYALLGTSPQMVVGPEATGSLLVGSLVDNIRRGAADEDPHLNTQISGVATLIAGVMLLTAGLGRVGFIDSVLNRPFMQGFISGVGFVLIVEQAFPELGLLEVAREAGVSHSSALVKLCFLLTHLSRTHILTAVMAMSSLAFILSCRQIQRRYSKELPWAKLFPDRLVVVVTTSLITWIFGLQNNGLEILGSLGSTSTLPTPLWHFSNMKIAESVVSTSFLMALLGFFESSVTAKSLRPAKDAPQTTTVSTNRELIALGTANVVGGCFTTLPAFGGFGRSKLNAQTGGTTPMSSLILATLSLLCVFFVLPSLHYVPKAVLSSMATVVGISMMEECPHDLKFFWCVRGWRELLLMSAVFLSTAVYSMSFGIGVGMVLTLFNLLQHSTRSRIQILGRIPGTKHAFEDAELVPHGDQIEKCLIVRIPEPLTFANVGDLRTRVRRFERYGSNPAHPSLPRLRDEDRYLIFDVGGLTGIDACATQILTEIVEEYSSSGTQVMFARMRPTRVLQAFQRSGIIDMCGGMKFFVSSVEEALKLAGMNGD